MKAAGYRRAAYQLLDRLEPYTPPTEAELQELLHGPRGASFADVLDEYDRRHGYRGATIKALSHACGLSPASLYHYFRSKEEMATYLLRGPRLDWDSTWVDPATDPLLQLRRLVDMMRTSRSK